MDYTVEIRNKDTNATVDTLRVVKVRSQTEARVKAQRFLDRNAHLANLCTGRVYPSTHR